MSQVTKEDILRIIADADTGVDVANVDASLPLREQGADSLDMMNILFAIMDEYNLDISDDSIAAREWLTIDKMVENVNQLRSARASDL